MHPDNNPSRKAGFFLLVLPFKARAKFLIIVDNFPLKLKLTGVYSALEDKQVQVLSDFWRSFSDPDIYCVSVSTQVADWHYLLHVTIPEKF